MSVIGINGRCIEGQPTGVGRYLSNLLHCRGKNSEQHHHFIIYTKSGTTVIDDFLRTHPCFEVKKIRTLNLPWSKKGLGWEQLFLAAELSQNMPDVFFSPLYKTPWYCRPACVQTIHDVSYEAHPEWFNPLSRWSLRIFSRRGTKKRKSIDTTYQGAVAFFYPSVYEGFGFPVLEAMACGTPVVTVSAASLPEVAGDAVLFVDPYDVQEISATMFRLATDEGLRQRLREKGLVRAKEFSWERCVRETMAVLEAVADGKMEILKPKRGRK